MDGLALLIAVVTFVMALVAHNRIAKLQTANFKLGQEIARLKSRLPVLAPATPTPTATAAAVEAALQAAPAEPAPEPAAEPAAPSPAVEDVAARTRPAPAPARRGDMEQALAGRWFVWIGGVAIAIGGLLFVKYAYDNGLISPELQVILGIGAGLLLVLAGLLEGRRGAAGYVPAALSAAGLAVLFGAIYASYALYAIVAPGTAFAGLAAVGLGALALARRQGPFIAALGLLGSDVTPALIPSSGPSAWTFFPYLLVILLASFLVLRGRRWWWLGYAALAGMVAWSVLWILGPFALPDVRPVGLAAIAMGLVALIVPEGRKIFREQFEPAALPPLLLAVAGLALQAAVLVLLVLVTNHAGTALGLLAVGLVLLLVLAWARRAVSALAPAAGVVMLAVLASWPGAAFHALSLDEFGTWSWSSSFGLESFRFFDWMLGSAAAFTLAGIAGVLFRKRTAPWGLLSGGAAVLFLWGAWARVDFLMDNQAWALLWAGAGLFLLLPVWAWSRRAGDDDLGAGFLALGSAILFVLALDRHLDGIWLTLAAAGLALVFAVLALVLKPRLMGPVTAGLASLAAIRLFASRELWAEDRSLPWGEHWVIYGYGLPALAFWLAGRLLRRAGHERSAVALEGMTLGLLVSLAALEIRVLIAGGITYEQPQFLEMAAHIITWLGAAWGLMHRQRLFPSVIATWGARLLLVMAAAGAIGLSLFYLNPVLTGEPVPGGLAFNALLLAYLAPVPLLALIARRLDVIGWGGLKPAVNLLALVLLFAYLTLETKRVFQGMIMEVPSESLAETYAYSAVWLGFALALFVAGIRFASQPVRLAGLAVLALVVLKVFFIDMSNLEGLWRIASFVGLGFCLVGIGWLYQHFVRGQTVAAAAGTG